MFRTVAALTPGSSKTQEHGVAEHGPCVAVLVAVVSSQADDLDVEIVSGLFEQLGVQDAQRPVQLAPHGLPVFLRAGHGQGG